MDESISQVFIVNNLRNVIFLYLFNVSLSEVVIKCGEPLSLVCDACSFTNPMTKTKLD